MFVEQPLLLISYWKVFAIILTFQLSGFLVRFEIERNSFVTLANVEPSIHRKPKACMR